MLIIQSLLLVPCLAVAKQAPLRNPFRSEDDEDAARSLVHRIANQTELGIPPILQPSTSPRQFVEEQR